MWFVRSGSRVTGPFTKDELKTMRGQGVFGPTHQISLDRIRWESAASLIRTIDGPGIVWQAPKPPPEPEPGPQNHWYYVGPDRQQKGPVPEGVLREMLVTRQLFGSTLVCKPGAQWARVSRQPELAGFVPASGGKAVLIGAASILGLGIAAMLLVTFLPKFRGKAGDKETFPVSAESPWIVTSSRDHERLAQSVGKVVCGWSVLWKTGRIQIIRESSGSCFSISKDGFLVTNDHVIDSTYTRKNATPEWRIVDYCDFFKKQITELQVNLASAIASGQLSPEATNDIKARLKFLEELKIVYDPNLYQKVDPKIWVFFGSKDDMYDAEIVHVSTFDMSVLRLVDLKKAMPYLKLAGADELPSPGDRVVALGYPGADSKFGSEIEKRLRSGRERESTSNIQGQFLDKDFILSRREGDVSRMTLDPGYGMKIEHGADIKHGNSGGPLIDANAKVIGINTWGSKGEDDVSGTFFSLAMSHIRNEIDRAIEKARDARDRQP